MFWNKKENEVTPEIDDQKRERLFFHDVINQTHGLLLFLAQKQSQNLSIETDEIKMLEREIRSLQSLIKDHFNFKHKNLSTAYDWVPFSFAESSLQSLIKNYLPEKSVKTSILLKGDLDASRASSVRENAVIYFPAFYRIMNNLIKNIAEAKSSEVTFSFEYGYHGFIIETQNKFNSLNDLHNISEKLSRMILDEKPSVNGLGLESIHHLASESGGQFEFEIAGGIWINRITLPLSTIDSGNKKAA